MGTMNQSLIPLLNAQQMRLCDHDTIENKGIASQVLMERAAKCAIDVMMRHPATDPRDGREVVVLCGSGNNGGDGFAMARFLAERKISVVVAYAGAWSGESPLCERMRVECARQYGLWCSVGGETLPSLPSLQGRIVVDALLGTDLHGAPRAPMDAWIEAVNQSDCAVLAVDIPSGVDATTGAVYVAGAPLLAADCEGIPVNAAIRADVTATMAYPKRGLIFYPGAALSGEVCVCDIGVGCDCISPEMYLLRPEHLALVPRRPAYANKGTFGRVAVIGGNVGMCGAPYFAAKAALRAGVGLAELVVCEENRVPLQTLLPEAVMTILPSKEPMQTKLRSVLARSDVAVLGCGMGQDAGAHERLALVLEYARGPLVLDADALNIIAADERGTYRERLRKTAAEGCVVITPHLGEAARLLGKGVGELARDLPGAAVRLAKEYGVICVLKDTRTVISDGNVAYTQDCGNSALAKGGTGDCLAGVIGAMLCLCRNQALSDTPLLPVSLGVLVHAMAGDRAAAVLGEYAPLAREIADYVGVVLKERQDGQ